MLRFLNRFKRDTRGVIAIEFGISLPLLILLFFGTLEICRVQYMHVFLENMLVNISLEAKTSCGNISIDTLVSNHVSKLSPMLTAEDITVTAESANSLILLLHSPGSGLGSDGDAVKLELRANVSLFSWLLPESMEKQYSYIIYYMNEADESTDADD